MGGKSRRAALVRDAINVWTADRIAGGMTAAQVKAELDTFDVWDRYDYDGDGNFDEAEQTRKPLEQ